MTTTVRIDKSDDSEIWTVTIDRPEVRNAVDGPTARALADAFRAFDADATRASPSSPAPAATSAPAPTCARSRAARRRASSAPPTRRSRSPSTTTWAPTGRWGRAGSS